MYLKNIEIQGFKSFANKIVFDFHNGITGIVGPNGSGKSNVADAVRWVLGEQRVKQLRGGNMQDVIFSGTETRKPLSYATVAITLDNSDHHLPIDYNEVTIARKLYRSGESEYLINGSVCRLKDVNELFYDTGIGKEGYSIIGQGQIDKILSGKPEERRELFDEAAGIVKFKRRKNMSVKKLEEERQNLVRVTDILRELEKQVGPLQRQSEVAKEYLKKKEALKTYDINMFLMETARLKEEIAVLDEKIKIVQDEIAGANAEYEHTKAEYEAIELQTDEIDAALELSKHQLNETTLLKQQLESKIQLLREQINTARMNDEHLANRANAINLELEEREKQLCALETEKETLQKQIDVKAEEEKIALNQLISTQTRIAELTNSIESGQLQLIELLNNRSSTKAMIQKYDTMLEQIQVRKAELNQRLIVAQTEVIEYDESISLHKKELEDISSVIISHRDEIKSYDNEINKLQSEINEKTEQFRVSQKTYHREESRLESLRNLTERYDGYGNSIRKVMEQRERVKGIRGVVADLIKVNKDYEVAIETALGGSIQNIVTDDERTAKELIQYLKQNKYGRATFLPLTSIEGNGLLKNTEVLNEKGVIGTANTLVNVEEDYRKLADHLLGRTIVVEHIDCGIYIAKKYKQTLRIVTLEGELINPGGAMTGGAFKNSSNLLSRRREIEELETSVLKLKEAMKQMEVSVENSKNLRTEFYNKIEVIKEKLQKAFVLQNTAKMNYDQVASKKEEVVRLVEYIRKELKDLTAQAEEIEDNQVSIQVELETSESLENGINSDAEVMQKELEIARDTESKQKTVTEEMHVSFVTYEQKRLFLTENEERIREEIIKFQEELSALDESKGNAAEEIVEKEKQIQELKQTIVDSKELFAEIEAEIQKHIQEKEELNKKHKVFLEKRESLYKHINELDKETFRLTNSRTSLEETSDKHISYMWDEYELTYVMALEIRDENLTDLAFMKKRIQVLKAEIKALGSVNVNAIEEYKSVSERYEFLKTQHDDLIEAEATLVKIIEELDQAMRVQFRERFQEISVEYDKVFKQLFGGGKGTLELMEDEDILEAGIRIIAQPPGKKLQNMMQLSGGEKALTAIALLFAIQNLKPSPFCLLDEIEAALDDSNVDRFAKYLHKLTKHTQFIVITHRRGTMTAADRLYGITMQEKGVSTLVSVDLLEHELDN